MGQEDELGYLSERLQGPILKIEDPREYSREDILKSYYREILLIANRFTRPGIEKADLVNEGIIGLLDAIERWDPEKAKSPKNFHQLAIVRIKNAMYDFFLRNSTHFKISINVARGLNYLDRIRRLVADADFSGDREQAILNYEYPEFEEGVSAEAARKLRRAKEKLRNLAESTNSTYEKTAARMLRISRELDDFEREVQSNVESPEALTADREFMQSMLSALNPEARDIVEMSLAGMTLEEIGEVKGKTRQRIQQIRKDVLDILRRTRMYRTSFEE